MTTVATTFATPPHAKVEDEGQIIIVDCNYRKWHHGAAASVVNGPSIGNDNGDILPPDVETAIKNSAKPASAKKPPKVRAAARKDAPPIHEIFADAAKETDDPMWVNLLKRMSRNDMPKGCRYFPMSAQQQAHSKGPDLSMNRTAPMSPSRAGVSATAIAVATGTASTKTVGTLAFYNKKEQSCEIPSDAFEALTVVKDFLFRTAGIVSEDDTRRLNEVAALNAHTNPLNALPKKWSDVKDTLHRGILLNGFAKKLKTEMGLTDTESRDLITTLHIGAISTRLNDDNIVMSLGVIEQIKGLERDVNSGDFYLSLDTHSKNPISIQCEMYIREMCRHVRGVLEKDDSEEVCFTADNVTNENENTKESAAKKIAPSVVFTTALDTSEREIVRKRSGKHVEQCVQKQEFISYALPTNEETQEYVDTFRDKIVDTRVQIISSAAEAVVATSGYGASTERVRAAVKFIKEGLKLNEFSASFIAPDGIQRLVQLLTNIEHMDERRDLDKDMQRFENSLKAVMEDIVKRYSSVAATTHRNAEKLALLALARHVKKILIYSVSSHIDKNMSSDLGIDHWIDNNFHSTLLPIVSVVGTDTPSALASGTSGKLGASVKKWVKYLETIIHSDGSSAQNSRCIIGGGGASGMVVGVMPSPADEI
jgi:hypothetical protein